MSDYSENYIKIQKLLKEYHMEITNKNYIIATEIAHKIADETFYLKINTDRLNGN